MFLDQNGLIVQSNGDGGDTAQRTGFFFTFSKFREILGLQSFPQIPNMATFQGAVSLLITPAGLVRSPLFPYNNVKDTSRDQTRPMLIALGLFGFADLVKQISPNGFLNEFYPNGDIASPENWNEVRRALGRPPLSIGDLNGFLDGMSRCIQASKNPDDVGDDLNTFLTLSFFYLASPTNISTASLKYYLKNRPTNLGTMSLPIEGWFPEIDPVLGAISWYNRPENVYRPQGQAGGNQELVEICRPVIERMRSDLDAAL